MPRRARNYVPGYPYHLWQRGNNKQPVFFADRDCAYYINLWRLLSPQYEVEVHAYVLMSNHYHFLATSREKNAFGQLIKAVHETYARYINHHYERVGTLWAGRNKASLVDSREYLFVCYRYIELNPVRAGLVSSPGQYRWSSHAANAYGEGSWLTPHPEYLALGDTPDERHAAYQGFFDEQLTDEELTTIRAACRSNSPLTDPEPEVGDVPQREVEGSEDGFGDVPQPPE